MNPRVSPIAHCPHSPLAVRRTMPSLLSPITLKALSLFTLPLASFSSAENRQSCLPTGETCDTSGETNYFPYQVSFSASDVVNCDYHNWFKTCTYKDEEDRE